VTPLAASLTVGTGLAMLGGMVTRRERKKADFDQLVEQAGWKPWKPSMHSTGICLCRAMPAYKKGDRLRCAGCLRKDMSEGSLDPGSDEDCAEE
jgi:hypothetical protein